MPPQIFWQSLVEEPTKGPGVLFVFSSSGAARHGTIDGVVWYAKFTASGFAFVEITPSTSFRGGSTSGTIFVTRGVLSPFAHLT